MDAVHFDLSPTRREALILTPLPLQGRGWGLGFSAVLHTTEKCYVTAILVSHPEEELGNGRKGEWKKDGKLSLLQSVSSVSLSDESFPFPVYPTPV